MKSRISISVHLTIILLFVASIAIGQQITTPAPSPSSKLVQSVGLIDITVDYSRPSMKGRDIFGSLVPYGEVWRTGANSATKITFSGDVEIAGKTLSAGSYAVLSIPGEKEWKFHFYPYESPSWPSYVEKTPMVIATASPKEIGLVETFTIDIQNLRNDGATLNFIWENTEVEVPVSLNTKETVMAQINRFAENPDMSLSNAYYSAASYMLTEKENLEMALDFATKAADMRPQAYWMKRTQALIYAELGRFKDAIAAAEASKAAAEKAGNNDYVRMNEASIAEWKKK